MLIFGYSVYHLILACDWTEVDSCTDCSVVIAVYYGVQSMLESNLDGLRFNCITLIPMLLPIGCFQLNRRPGHRMVYSITALPALLPCLTVCCPAFTCSASPSLRMLPTALDCLLLLPITSIRMLSRLPTTEFSTYGSLLLLHAEIRLCRS